jgi:arylformamidase
MTENAAAVDYEAEYDNRGRVPEHPAIFAGWARDAAAYRDQVAPAVLAYGAGEREKLDLFDAGDGPIVLFVHGGYWQALDRSWFSWAARGLNRRGVSVAVPSYDLCPTVPLATIVEQMRAACRTLARTGRPLVASGHSAGGHLSACLLADRLVRSAYAISGLFDLVPLTDTRVNLALGLDRAEAERLSPLAWTPPAGLSLDAVVGGAESGEYLRQSRAIVARWGAAGVATRFEARPGDNHFTVIAPLADPDSGMVARLAALAG